MIRLLFLTLALSSLLLASFELLRWSPLPLEIKLVVYLLLFPAIIVFYIKICRDLGYLQDFD